MSDPAAGYVLIYCPQCGVALEAAVEVETLSIGSQYHYNKDGSVYVEFKDKTVNHYCEGGRRGAPTTEQSG
jgi:hypothetical protein